MSTSSMQSMVTKPKVQSHQWFIYKQLIDGPVVFGHMSAGTVVNKMQEARTHVHRHRCELHAKEVPCIN